MEEIGIDDARLVEEAHLKRVELTGQKEFRFEIGKLAVSEAVLDMMEQTKKEFNEKNKTPEGSFTNFIWRSFARHCVCDWGEVSPEEEMDNELAINEGRQLYSVYTNPVYSTICILTEGDRSETSIGLLGEIRDIDK